MPRRFDDHFVSAKAGRCGGIVRCHGRLASAASRIIDGNCRDICWARPGQPFALAVRSIRGNCRRRLRFVPGAERAGQPTGATGRLDELVGPARAFATRQSPSGARADRGGIRTWKGVGNRESGCREECAPHTQRLPTPDTRLTNAVLGAIYRRPSAARALPVCGGRRWRRLRRIAGRWPSTTSPAASLSLPVVAKPPRFANRSRLPGAASPPGRWRSEPRKKSRSLSAIRQRFRRRIRHGIDQPAGRPDHGHGAVLQAVKLIQSARLIAAGHQENVGSRLDPVGQRRR